MSSGSAQRRANISSQTMAGAGMVTGIMAASAAANAVPVAGQIASAVLAVAGALTMVFAGKKQRREEGHRESSRINTQKNLNEVTPNPQPGTATIGGQQAQQSVQQTAPVPQYAPPTLQYNSGAQNDTVQPPQRLGGQ